MQLHISILILNFLKNKTNYALLCKVPIKKMITNIFDCKKNV